MGSARLVASGRTKALSALIASLCEASSTLHGVQPRLSQEAKAKTPFGASSVAASVSLSLTSPGAKDLCCEARNKATLGANSKVILASLEGKALHRKTKLASRDRAKTVVSPCEATLSGERKPSWLRQWLLCPRGLTFSLLNLCNGSVGSG